MTREEILNTPEIVDFMIDKSVMVDSKMKLHKRLEELCKLAIKALEIQACKPNGDDWESYADRLYELAYQHGQGDKEPCEDCISRQEAISAIIDEYYPNAIAIDIVDSIANLPSVAPKAKTGRWIAQNIHNCHTDFKCSACGYIHSFMHLYGKPTADYTYCPNCGAKMQEVEE